MEGAEWVFVAPTARQLQTTERLGCRDQTQSSLLSFISSPADWALAGLWTPSQRGPGKQMDSPQPRLWGDRLLWQQDWVMLFWLISCWGLVDDHRPQRGAQRTRHNPPLPREQRGGHRRREGHGTLPEDSGGLLALRSFW